MSTAPAAPLPPGSTLGAYLILEFVAAGGMGMVYKARHRVTNELRALKVILPEFAADELFVARFLREVKIAAAVEHANLVETYEPGMEGQVVFLPMELLNGETLAEKLQRVSKLECEEALRVMVPVCDAVAAVHARDILHRDLKPANIFLHRPPVGSTVPKVLDFGAARQIDAPDEATRSGTVIGTVFYMAPEQAAGARHLDAAVDQWAIAVMLYQMLTGRRPYENDDRETALAKLIAGRPYPKPRELDPTLPKALEAVILRALEREPRKRFHSVAAFGDALRRSLDDEHTVLQLAASDVGSSSLTPSEPDGTQRRGRAESRTVPGAVIELTTKKDAINPGRSWVAIGAVLLASAVVGLAVMGRRSQAAIDEAERAGASAVSPEAIQRHIQELEARGGHTPPTPSASVEPTASAPSAAPSVVASASAAPSAMVSASASPSAAPSVEASASPSASASAPAVASASAAPEAVDAGVRRRRRSDEDMSNVVVRYGGGGSGSSAPAAPSAAAVASPPPQSNAIAEPGSFRPLVLPPSN